MSDLRASRPPALLRLAPVKVRRKWAESGPSLQSPARVGLRPKPALAFENAKPIALQAVQIDVRDRATLIIS
jgi:hypothetical protein